MKKLPIALIASAIGLALIAAAPAEAAQSGKHKKHAAHSVNHRHAAVYAQGGPGFQGGVLAGPLYNGQDYLGTDPDPNIRSYILRDLNSRYGGGR